MKTNLLNRLEYAPGNWKQRWKLKLLCFFPRNHAGVDFLGFISEMAVWEENQRFCEYFTWLLLYNICSQAISKLGLNDSFVKQLYQYLAL